MKNKESLSRKMTHAAHSMVLRFVRQWLQQGAVSIDTEKCKGCELCSYACPAHTLSLVDNVNQRGYRYTQQIKEDACIGCASCALVCPDSCITVYRTGLLAKVRKKL